MQDFFYTKFEERTTIYSKFHLERYLKFCQQYVTNPTTETKVHIHHILPKSLFPEFKNFNESPFNKCILPIRAHLIAHYMLAKAIGGSMWYAFNFMNNFNVRFNSRLYEHAMIEFSKYNSESKRGLVPVRNLETGECMIISVEDERYVSGEVVHVAAGTKRTKEYKESKKGKITAYNPYTMEYIGIVSVDDPRFETGEICGNKKEFFTEDDKKYNYFFRTRSRPTPKIKVYDKKSRLVFMMYEDDWRVKVGLYGLVKNTKNNEEREKISKKMKKIQKDKVTVFDTILGKNVRISKTEFDETRHIGIGKKVYKVFDVVGKEYVMDKSQLKEFCEKNSLSFDCFMTHVGKGKIEKSRYTHKKYQSRINTSGWMIEVEKIFGTKDKI